MRKANISRKTEETDIQTKVNLDGTGECIVNGNLIFLNHLIRTLATHSLIDINITAKGDLAHHIIEDTAICLGKAINQALGERKGIKRFGNSLVPMDESLAIAAVDLVKRPYFKANLDIKRKEIDGLPSENILHFLNSLTTSMKANIHLYIKYGKNDHHKVEATFKALALSLKDAIKIDKRQKNIPSSKGLI
jgi:imidazoleglycerol-phosphate dehydratase